MYAHASPMQATQIKKNKYVYIYKGSQGNYKRHSRLLSFYWYYHFNSIYFMEITYYPHLKGYMVTIHKINGYGKSLLACNKDRKQAINNAISRLYASINTKKKYNNK